MGENGVSMKNRKEALSKQKCKKHINILGVGSEEMSKEGIK